MPLIKGAPTGHAGINCLKNSKYRLIFNSNMKIKHYGNIYYCHFSLLVNVSYKVDQQFGHAVHIIQGHLGALVIYIMIITLAAIRVDEE